MKYAIFLAILYAPLSYPADYEQEILEHVIAPCLQTRLGVDTGAALADDPESVEEIIARHGDEFEEQIELLESLLVLLPVTASLEERKELYQAGLVICLGQEQNLGNDPIFEWAAQILASRIPEDIKKQYLWHFVFYAILAIWVFFDARNRKNNVSAWPVLTAVAGLIALPVYLAKRNLKEGETRTGGTGWNVMKYFAVFWTLSMGVEVLSTAIFISGITTEFKTVAVIIGSLAVYGIYAITWLVVIVCALVLGLILRKKSVIEEGPAGPLTEAVQT